jgi:hypothetical protein
LALAKRGGKLRNGLGVADVASHGGGMRQARGEAGKRALIARGENEMESAFRERLGNGLTEAA